MSFQTPAQIVVDEGIYRIVLATPITVGSDIWDFSYWSDLSPSDNQYANPTRDVDMTGVNFVDKAINGIYAERPLEQGTLSIDTQDDASNPVSGQIYVNGSLQGSGSWSGILDVGSYTVSFGPVTGYVTPSSQIANISSGVQTNVRGIYVPIAAQTYDVTVTVTREGVPVQGAFVSILTGPSGGPDTITDANGQAVFTALLAGQYIFVATYSPSAGKIETGRIVLDPSSTSTGYIAVVPVSGLGGMALPLALGALLVGAVLIGSRKKK